MDHRSTTAPTREADARAADRRRNLRRAARAAARAGGAASLALVLLGTAGVPASTDGARTTTAAAASVPD
jgi:hypothetical protein